MPCAPKGSRYAACGAPPQRPGAASTVACMGLTPGRPDAKDWTQVDAWILAATSSAAQGCTLTDLVATADGINHAVPSTAEIADSLAHLIGSGLLLWDGDHILLTPAGRAMRRSWRQGLFSWSKALLPRLRTVPRVRGDLPFGDAEIDAARAAYLARH